MRTFFAWLAILGFLPPIVRAAMIGTLSVPASAGLMFLMVVAVAVGVKKFLLKVVLPVAGVSILAAQYANGDTHTFWSICCGILTLSLVMLGFYLMISGLFRSKR